MSSKPDVTPKPSRRAGRPKKTPEPSTQTKRQTKKKDGQTLAPEASSESPFSNNVQSYDGAAASEILDLSVDHKTNPTTPLRTRSAHAVPTISENDHSIFTQNSAQPKSRGKQKEQDENQLDHLKDAQNKPSMTPLGSVKTGVLNGTPSKAYAGPTFHASPAASSLPLPRFFSKSVPNVNKTVSLKSNIEQEASETASESEGSQHRDHSEQNSYRAVREESPLDIFFQADRREKARMGSSTPEQKPNDRNITRQSLRSEASPSTNHLEPRHHSRHPTDSSIGGVFPLEMDGNVTSSKQQHPPQNQYSHTDKLRPLSPSAGIENEQSEEARRQAQTAALKNMLFSPKFQQNAALPPEILSSSTQDSPSSPSKTPRGRVTPSRNPPPSSAGLASDESRAQRHATLLALAHKQIPNNNSPYTSPRPPSSGLRKEVVMPPSPHLEADFGIPATPTPSRVHNKSTPTPTKHSSASHGMHTRSKGFEHQAMSGNTNAKNESSATKSIEDDLRRILKLDVLGDTFSPKTQA